MRTLKFVFATLFLPLLALADGTTFTTVFYDDGGQVYVGLKNGKGDEGRAQIITFPYPMGDRTQIPLPDEIVHRDVIGLIPEKDKLFVLTANGGGAKDGPMLHVFDKERNTWKKVGKIECASFTKVTLSSHGMKFSCETGVRKTRKGPKSIMTPKTIAYGSDRLFRNGVWRFPEFMWRYKGVLLTLEGPAPDWDKLRIKAAEGERLLNADDLFQLPAPPKASEIAPAKGAKEAAEKDDEDGES
jgi:hypothetical protein